MLLNLAKTCPPPSSTSKRGPPQWTGGRAPESPGNDHRRSKWKKTDSFRNNIEFRNVRFAYEDVTILENINLVVGKGRTIALVVARAPVNPPCDLVPRFHDVTSGETADRRSKYQGLFLRSINGTDEHRNTRTHPL